VEEQQAIMVVNQQNTDRVAVLNLSCHIVNCVGLGA